MDTKPLTFREFWDSMPAPKTMLFPPRGPRLELPPLREERRQHIVAHLLLHSFHRPLPSSA